MIAVTELRYAVVFEVNNLKVTALQITFRRNCLLLEAGLLGLLTSIRVDRELKLLNVGGWANLFANIKSDVKYMRRNQIKY